ncbi:hypothetical protein ACH5RR_016384 [Cinchona calisaya]|uniref:Protein kinase domain-containing protein n=1 Tax=Cinchona calisaya TaxID=153742 RepID=A0ABD2ZVQ4_9GENT
MFLSGESVAAQISSSFSVDPLPYNTSRISSTEFGYSFQLNPAGPFTLLGNFSASLAAQTLGVKYLVKEFCLNVEENTRLNITFLPSQIPNSNLNLDAFVNGIEIISMPTSLYYTPDGDLGARVVGGKDQFHSIVNTTALELTHRLNIGGSFISSVEDFGMFRRWSEDANYLLESNVHRVNHQAHRIKYEYIKAFVAPPKLYQTSWKKTGGNIRVNPQEYNFTWKIPIELGFGYLVRLHFCEFDGLIVESEQREFSVLINNQMAETKADVIGWSGGNGIPAYRDYMVKMEGNKGGSNSDLLIALQSVNELVFGLLNGLEIFKLSNLDNSLATPNPTFPKRLSASWNLRFQKVFLAFGKSNVIVTGMTILIILVNVVVYNLRQTWEEKLNLEKDAQAARTVTSYHRFSLAEIKLATQNFSDTFVIGRGGFGKVYRGFIHSISEDVAIKRLSLYSRQGAREFWTEIETLSKLRHVHLVSLLGYCNEDEEMILVYEYMPCGTLADNLYKLSRKGKDIAPLSWEQRLKICIGAARGMDYLHTGTECTVIHRDVKDSNILLDENFVAKISDFGLSKLEKIAPSKSYVSTKIKGTAGYWDPEYVTTGRLTRKSDVYSFGVVLLVVLAGRPVKDTINEGEPQSLLSCFHECITEGGADRIVDTSLQGKISANSLRQFLKSVENCLHYLPKRRPTMAQVIASLEQALELQERPMTSSSRNATVVGQEEVSILVENVIPNQEEVPVLGENVIIPSPEYRTTSELTQNPYSPNRGNGLQFRKKYNNRVPKLSWNWPWKAVWNRGKKQNAEVAFLKSQFQEQPPVLVYSYNTLAIATNNFQSENLIGRGSFGRVYKGVLVNGLEIAVKMCSYLFRISMKDLISDVEIHSRLQHRNIVRLLGYCADGEAYLLVYEYMPNCSLDSFIFDPTKGYLLDWDRRAIIIEGIGRALLYLHRDSSLKIIHRDLRTRKILLDTGLYPKISDFGLARVLEPSQDAETTRVVGTFGYIDPEYLITGKVSVKLDVYGYGVLLLEIVSGKKITEFIYGNNENKKRLMEYAWKLWNENEILDLVDPKLEGPYDETQIQRYVHVALLCVQASAIRRPDMSTVLSMLNGEIAELPQPNSPSSSVRSYGAIWDSLESECSQETEYSVGDDAYPTDWVTF